MNIVFTMCFTGSCLFLFYLLVTYFFKNNFTNNWNYMILKIALVLFFTPLGIMKRILYRPESHTNFLITGNHPTTAITPDGLYANFAYKLYMAIVLLWLFMAFSIFLWQQLKYFHFKRLLLQSVSTVTDCALLEYLATSCQTMGIRKNIQLYYSNQMSPFTTGIFSPIIILPANLSFDKQKLVLKHELIHVKHHDTLFLFLRRLVTCVYWFNPLVYLFEYQLEKIVELSCDESVILDMEQNERKEYATLVLDLSLYDVQYQRAYVSSFSHNSIHTKERMDFIMKPQKKKKIARNLSVIIAAGMVLCSSFTSLAYQLPAMLPMSSSSAHLLLSDFDSSDSFIAFQSGPFVSTGKSGTLLYDNQFTDIHGNIYNMDASEASNHRACEHNYVDGVISKHKKNSNGGCVIRYYEAQRCTKCGSSITGALIDTETHDVCLH